MGQLSDFLAQAQAQARKKAQAEAQKIAASKKHRAQLIQENRQRKLREASEKRKRTGQEIAQSFLQEVSEPFLRMVKRDDASSLDGIKIILQPYKGDHGPYSFHIENNGKRTSFPNGSVREFANKQGWENERLIRKLEQQGGFDCSSMAEMLEEILRLRSLLRLSHDRVKELEATTQTSSAEEAPEETPAENPQTV